MLGKHDLRKNRGQSQSNTAATGRNAMSDTANRRPAGSVLTQEAIVFLIFIIAFVGFAFALGGFLTIDNIGSLLQNVSLLGILSLAMGLVVIGRGIDLSIVAVMAITMAWSISLMNLGYSLPLALAAGFLLALLIGAIQGILIAYVEIPALFATLAMASVIYGFGRIFLVEQDIIHLSTEVGALRALGSG